jgi:hypothetical protein
MKVADAKHFMAQNTGRKAIQDMWDLWGEPEPRRSCGDLGTANPDAEDGQDTWNVRSRHGFKVLRPQTGMIVSK